MKAQPKEEYFSRARMEAFSDGVMAIVITLLAIELKVPHGHDAEDLKTSVPVFTGFLLSFLFVGHSWIRHHLLLHHVNVINKAALWANLLFLFWLTLVPFTTGWAGESKFALLPLCIYALDLALCAFTYQVLRWTTINQHPEEE